MSTSSIETITIRSKDGVHSKISIFRCHEAEAPIVLILPAMGVRASFYESFALAMVEHGLNVVTADLRGHGESSVRPAKGANYGYDDMVRNDWSGIITQINQSFPDSTKIILGHSLGAQLSMIYLAEHPSAIDGFILVTAPSLHYKHWPFPRCLTLFFSTQIFALIARVLGYFPGPKLGIGGIEAKQMIADWARVVRSGRYDMIKPGTDYTYLIRNLRIPTLAISFSDDDFAPQKAVNHLCQKMPRASLTRWHFSPKDFNCEKLGHFWWINQREKLAQNINDWINKVLSNRK